MKNSVELTQTKLASKSHMELARKAESVVLDLVKQSHSVYRREINDWQQARMTRESIDNPRTHMQKCTHTRTQTEARA